MDRVNIFQRIANNYNLENAAERLDRLFRTEDLLCTSNIIWQSIKEYVDECGFSTWKNRNHFVDLDDYLDTLGYKQLLQNAKSNVESYLTLIELIINMWQIVQNELSRGNPDLAYDDDFYLLHDIMIEELSHYNHKAIYDKEREQVLVVEDKPEITVVAEIVEPNLALAVVRYNHQSMSGDLAGKKAILLALGCELEPQRKALEGANKRLAADIFYMLNNMDLRHNNRNEKDKNYREFVAKMRKGDLEKWYDELYQMMLLAFLELAQIERQKRVEELKSKITI